MQEIKLFKVRLKSSSKEHIISAGSKDKVVEFIRGHWYSYNIHDVESIEECDAADHKTIYTVSYKIGGKTYKVYVLSSRLDVLIKNVESVLAYRDDIYDVHINIKKG